MNITDALYTLGVATVTELLPLVAYGEGKLARGIRGMRGALVRLEQWAEEHRDAARPLVWFHAPSVGEGLQARAVVEAFRSRHEDAQIAYTFFSPSAEEFARTVGADVYDYLPPDLPGQARRAFDALRPDAVVFSKTEVWPNLTSEAKRRGIPLALLSATLPSSASRLRRPARAFLAVTHSRLSVVGAVSRLDANRYAALGVPPERREVMGDARFDQVWQRASRVDRRSGLLATLGVTSAPTLVAGSTWAADEKRILDAYGSLAAGAVHVRLIIVPHEPTVAALRSLEKDLRRRRIPHARLSDGASRAAEAPVLIVDRTGILGEIYALADIAYVGGGFGRAGLHSILEPAAFGAPVLFGPHHGNAREAAELIHVGAARSVADGEELASHLRRWLIDPAARAASGDAARLYVESGLGAADRGALLVQRMLNGGAVTA